MKAKKAKERMGKYFKKEAMVNDTNATKRLEKMKTNYCPLALAAWGSLEM